jgi:putative redox protein
MLTAKMHWVGGLKFEGTSAFGQKIATDGAKKAGGAEDGYKPTELFLFAIAGCTGIDIIIILRKQRQEVTGVEIEVVAHQNEGHPKPFHTVEVKYTFRGKNLDSAKVARAIDLSESKYCSVSQTVEYPGKVKTSFEIVPD